MFKYGFVTLTYFLLSASESFSEEGVCTRTEVVSKSRSINVYKTYVETYWGYCSSGWYRHECQKSQNSGYYVTQQQIYTEMEYKQYCCAGYQDLSTHEGTLRCSPQCDFTCSNGKCTQPNYCECFSGYSKKPGTENICEPVCSNECIHGYCSQPEHCECDPGYSLKPGSSYVCLPECTDPCINANCTSPDICTCLRGFAKTPKEPHKCHAVCSLPCHNGVCTSPDECTCFEGYKQNSSIWNKCEPVCTDGCKNGECIAPDECKCHDGFQNNETGICEPECSQECMNAQCTEPEICSCFPGYQKSSADPNSCFPVCSHACVNSNCTEPDRCECYPGFEETDDAGKCRPYCSEGCEDGICSRPEECTCLWGFDNKGNSSECTRRPGENLDCTFITKVVNHKFNHFCFELAGKISLNFLENCSILQLVTSLNEAIQNATLELYCEGNSDLELSKNRLSLGLQCVVNKSTSRGNLGFEDVSSTLTSHEEELTDYYETTTYVSSFETSFMTDDSFSSEIYESSTHRGLSYTTSPQQHEFNVVSVENSPKSELTQFPLQLNITLQFLSLVRSSQITHNVFNNISIVKKDWCLCHGNGTNWSICASSPVNLYLCTCEPKGTQTSMEESRSVLSLKAGTKLMLLVMAVLLLAYILYTTYKAGSYDTKRSEELIGEPMLSIDLDSLDRNRSCENAREDT